MSGDVLFKAQILCTAVCAWVYATDGMLYEPGFKRGF